LVPGNPDNPKKTTPGKRKKKTAKEFADDERQTGKKTTEGKRPGKDWGGAGGARKQKT